jgi:hypothetical protein
LARHRETLRSNTGLDYATNLIRRVCHLSGQFDLIEDVRSSFAEIGLLDAIRLHDDDALFGWLAEAISYQGISDSVAAGYLEQHGTVEASDIRRGLAGRASCPKLRSYWHFENCGYKKTARTCNGPKHLARCPLPRHDLRNGVLSQASYALHLFMRDVAAKDFVGWIDGRLQGANREAGPDRVKHLCASVIEPLRHVHGISDKVLNMTLANLLLAGDPGRELWVEAGAGMIAIDTLVHNWLHRSGVLSQMKAGHAYGAGCYRPGGCSTIIEQVALRIDARDFNRRFPAVFPRFVQKTIWHFCAGQGFDQCNGNQIDDAGRCGLRQCPLFKGCGRVALNIGMARSIVE